MSLRVVAVIAAQPGSEDLIGEALSSLVQPTREEEGCLSYDLFHSVAEPSTFVTIEEWTDQAALDAHMQTAHIAAAFEKAGDKMAGAPAIHPLEPMS